MLLELVLPDMNCAHCEKAVTQAVHAIDSGATLDIDLATGRVRIETRADEREIAMALAREGYPPAA